MDYMPLYIRIFKAVKILQSFSQPFSHDKAEVGQNSLFTNAGPDKTEAGPGVTTRRIVAPKPGLVCYESKGAERAWTLKVASSAEPS